MRWYISYIHPFWYINNGSRRYDTTANDTNFTGRNMDSMPADHPGTRYDNTVCTHHRTSNNKNDTSIVISISFDDNTFVTNYTNNTNAIHRSTVSLNTKAVIRASNVPTNALLLTGEYTKNVHQSTTGYERKAIMHSMTIDDTKSLTYNI